MVSNELPLSIDGKSYSYHDESCYPLIQTSNKKILIVIDIITCNRKSVTGGDILNQHFLQASK